MAIYGRAVELTPPKKQIVNALLEVEKLQDDDMDLTIECEIVRVDANPDGSYSLELKSLSGACLYWNNRTEKLKNGAAAIKHLYETQKVGDKLNFKFRAR